MNRFLILLEAIFVLTAVAVAGYIICIVWILMALCGMLWALTL